MMVRKTLAALSLAVVMTTSFASPAFADRGRRAWGWGRGHHRHGHDDGDDDGHRGWRHGYDRGRWRHRCGGNGTTGLLVGGGAGALLGRALDHNGDRAVGTILGATGGALLGRQIERGSGC